MKRLSRNIAIVCVLGACALGPAGAQSFPSKTVRIVVPFAAGGAVDGLVRSLGKELSERWGQPVIVDNQPGGGTLLGTGAASRATADGYTLLATTSQTFTTNRFLYKNLPYNPDTSFIPVSTLVKVNPFVLANADVPVKDLKQLVALAREKPGTMTYGSWGSGSEPQLILEQLNAREGLDLTHVPYKGVAPVLQALVSGEVKVSIASAAAAAPLIKAGRIKPLAVAGNERSAQFPSVPTASEAGFAYLQLAISTGLFAPAGTPAAVLDKIGRDVRDVLNTPSFAKEHVVARGFDVVASTQQEAQASLREEAARLRVIVETAKIKIE